MASTPETFPLQFWWFLYLATFYVFMHSKTYLTEGDLKYFRNCMCYDCKVDSLSCDDFTTV